MLTLFFQIFFSYDFLKSCSFLDGYLSASIFEPTEQTLMHTLISTHTHTFTHTLANRQRLRLVHLYFHVISVFLMFAFLTGKKGTSSLSDIAHDSAECLLLLGTKLNVVYLVSGGPAERLRVGRLAKCIAHGLLFL